MKRVIIPTNNQVLLADPTVLSPLDSPDKIWHLYCWSLSGLLEFVSNEGKAWQFKGYVLSHTMHTEKTHINLGDLGLQLPALSKYAYHVMTNAEGYITASYRPYVLNHKGVYYLYYEEMIFFWKNKYFTDPISKIKCIKSTDLINWSEPVTIIEDTAEFTFIACPSIMFADNKFTLFFSYDHELTNSSSLWEPKRIGYATSTNPDKGFTIQSQIKVVDENGQQCNQIGSFRTRKIMDQDVFLCNPIIRNANGITKSEIYFCDQISATEYQLQNKLVKESDFNKHKISDAYVADIVNHNDHFYTYFNVRRRNDFFDGFTLNRGAFGIFLLVARNVFFNREDIYLIQSQII
jgi:hypothetical protein